MKVSLKGNTSKTHKKYFPATDTKPATLYFDVAEKVKKQDGSELTLWYKVACFRGYADTTYRLLHGDKEISRYVQIEGKILSAPTMKVVNGKTYVKYTIYADEINYLDEKWPEKVNAQEAVPATDTSEYTAADEETPW